MIFFCCWPTRFLVVLDEELFDVFEGTEIALVTDDEVEVEVEVELGGRTCTGIEMTVEKSTLSSTCIIVLLDLEFLLLIGLAIGDVHADTCARDNVHVGSDLRWRFRGFGVLGAADVDEVVDEEAEG